MSAADLTNPQSMNLYAYVENNPVDFVDPSGLFKLALKEREFDWSGWWRFLMDSYEHSRPPSGGGGGGVHEPSGGGEESFEGDKSDHVKKCVDDAMKKYPNPATASEEEMKNFNVAAKRADADFQKTLGRIASDKNITIYRGFRDAAIGGVAGAIAGGVAGGAYGFLGGTAVAPGPGSALGAVGGLVVGLVAGGIIGISNASGDSSRAIGRAIEDLGVSYRRIREDYPAAARRSAYINARNGAIAMCNLGLTFTPRPIINP